MPEVTVLMTVYNGMPYLPLAIESILRQTCTDLEFLIVNDCSTDNSREVILSYSDPRIRLLDNEKNLKQTRALNRGLEHTRTELVARMDADDISHPRRLEMQVAYLRDHPEVVALGTGLRTIDSEGRVVSRVVRPENDLALRWMQLIENPISGGAVMFRKSIVWDKLGGFDPSIHLAQDYELWSRILPDHKLASLPDFLYDVRRHPDAETNMWLGVLDEEHQRISRASVRRVLGITDDSEPWFRNLNLLVPWSHAARHDHADLLLAMVDELFERFCTVYPAARNDPDVLRLLSKEYFRVVSEAGLSNLPTVVEALRRAWLITPAPLYMAQIARAVAIWIGARKLWTLRLKRARMTSRQNSH